MKVSQKICAILDRELLSANQLYLTMTEANKILLESNQFTVVEIRNQVLKKIMENGEMPNAVKLNIQPHQWIIFHSASDANKLVTVVEMELKKNKARKKILQEKIQSTNSHAYNINWWNRPNRIDPRFSNRYVTIALAITILVITLIFLPRNSDKEYDEFIDTRAKMMMLKEKGLATDKDIKRYEDAYYKSRRNK